MAEGVGFEPTKPCGLAVFKTAALDRTMRPLLVETRPLNSVLKFILSHYFLVGPSSQIKVSLC